MLRRRWPQFTLRQILFITGVVSVLCATARLAGMVVAVALLVVLCLAGIVRAAWRGNYRLAAVAMALLVAGAIALLPIMQVAIGVGFTTRSVTVVVRDAISKKPLPGATVRLRKLPEMAYAGNYPTHPIPAHEKGAIAIADAGGMAKLNWRFLFTSRTSLWGESASIRVGGDLWVQVEADGHKPVLMPMLAKIGQTFDYWAPAPTFEIELK